jgi:hypothetical protein
MDLYNPLYMNRPTVEPELFASLRPPTYGGAMNKRQELADLPPAMPSGGAPGGFGGGGGFGAGGPGTGGGMRGGMPRPAAKADGRLRGGEAPTEEQRRFAAEAAARLQGRMDLGASVQSVAMASSLGDYYQYVIDRPVDLARQKSALLPIVNKDVEGKRVSIYNPAVQPKHPLLGLRFKNTSGMPLTQGPVTVFEGSVYAGDTRVLDLQPDEERLVSYAIDLGTEVATKSGNNTSRITSVKAVKGIIHTNNLIREERVYDVSNRSSTDRTLLIEHPNRKGQGFAFKGQNQPKEEAADVYRFEVAVGAKKDLSYTVIEEREAGSSVQLTNNADDQIRYFISLKEAPEGLKEKLREALRVKGTWDKARQDIATVSTRVQAITTDQKRLRENLRETPKESPLFNRYLKTLEEQEKEMDDLSAKLKALHGDEAKSKAAYDDFLANLSAE